MNSLRRFFRPLPLSFALTAAAALLGGVDAIAGPPLLPDQPRLIPAKPGEEEQIRRRREWFLSTRRAGVDSVEEMAGIRAREIRSLQVTLDAQRQRRQRGLDAEQNFWVSMGPAPSAFGGWAFGDVSGRITDIARDAAGNVYIASAAGGVWRTANDGLSWTNVFETAGTQPTGAVAVDPNDDAVIWVGTGDFVTGCEGYFGIGLLRSGDGGATWESRNGASGSSLDDMSAFSSVVVDPRNSSHVVVGGTIRGCSTGQQQNGGLYTSDDAGTSWTARLSGMQVHEVVQDETNRDIWWAATDQGVWKSTNNAVTWAKQTASGLPSSGTGRTEIAVAPSNGNYVYVLFASGTGGGSDFWRTTNGGTSWTRMSSGGDACDGQCWYNMTLGVHRTNPDTVYRGTILLFKSTNGGANWTGLLNGWGGGQQVHQDIQALLVDPSQPDKFYVGSDGGLWRSSDGGASFVNMNDGLSLFLFYAIDHQESDTGVICGGAQDNSSLVRTTSNRWNLQTVTGDGFVCAIDPQNPSYAYITSYPNSYPAVYRSTSGVLGSFNVITGSGSGINAGDRIAWVTPYTLDPNVPSTLLLGTHRVYRSVNHGSSWEPVGPTDFTAGGGTMSVVEFNRVDSNVAYAGSSDGKLWRTTDNGVTWADISSGLPAGAAINDVGGDPENPDRALATIGGFNRAHLWEWTATSGTWTATGDGLPNVPANTVLMKTAAVVYVGTDIGVYQSVDGGTTFEPFMNGLPQGLVVTDLKFGRQNNVITAGTYGRGAYQVSVEPPGPIVLFDSIVEPLVEVDGDGDVNVEPGETWSVTPILRNAGGVAATAVTARLTTATAGVTLLEPGARGFGDVIPGGKAAALEPFTFVVDPAFECGATVVFDLVEIASANDPGAYRDRPAAFSVTVVDDYEPNLPIVALDEDFDPNPSGWNHEAVPFTQYTCYGATRKDEWRYATKEAGRGSSLHAGKGPSTNYGTLNNAWLYPAGKDSQGGAGYAIPANAVGATLTVVHWYDTEAGRDGGFVAIDASQDGADVFQPITPIGGYGSTLATGNCNAQEGSQAWSGVSGGFITSTFNLSAYAGKTVYLAFIFASDRRSSTSDEGWYVDQVKLDYETLGAPLCQRSLWPGLVPTTARFVALPGGAIEASWDPSCNDGSAAGQNYAIHAGSLAALAGAGTYNHAPVDDVCTRVSPAIFTPGTESEYYLVLPNLDGREGGAGSASDGTPRPHPSTTCGTWREASCP